MAISTKVTEKKSTLISERLQQIPSSAIRKLFDLLVPMEGVISLGVGEPDFVTPLNIREAAIKSIQQGQTMYTPNPGKIELREELSRYLKRLYGLEYDPKGQLMITVGVSEGLDLVSRAILNPGDEVIMTDPRFLAYYPCVYLTGGTPVIVPTYDKNKFEISAEDIESRITKKTKAILIGYPSNPTGAVMPRAKLQAVVDVARKHNVLVISDEIYARLVYEQEHVCAPTLSGAYENTILIGGLSKSHAMTGWRIGFLASPNRELIASANKIHSYTAICAANVSQWAAVEALRNSEDSVKKMVAEYDRRRRFIVKALNDMGLPCFNPGGAFYVFPSIKETGLKSEEFCERALKEAKVGVVPGNAFGELGEGHIRCCYAVAYDSIVEAMRRLEGFVKTLRR